MGHIAITFDKNELKYYLFKKKNCPICGNKMTKYTDKTYVGKVRDYNSIGNSSMQPDEYRINIYYRCDNCGKLFSLQELAKRTYGDDNE